MSGCFKICMAAAAAGAIALAGCATMSETSSAARFSFAVIGDLGYEEPFEPQLDRVLDEINRTPLSFVVHLGDLASPPRACSDEVRAKRLAQLKATAHPTIFTPGDNDWTDCHEQQTKVKTYTPDERLSNLRQMFFPGPNTLGQRTFALKRQSDSADASTARYRENARWEQGGVVFLTVHLVGSNNNRGRTAEADAEFVDRTSANIKWLRDGFRHAAETNARAVIIFTQANIFFDNTPVAGDRDANPSGFTETRNIVEELSTAFRKPVLFVHGDTHYFRVDKPLGNGTRQKRGQSLENFTRLEGFGQPNHHWVHVTVEPDDPGVFTIRERIVRGNILERGSSPSR
jgi:hypothetical protein